MSAIDEIIQLIAGAFGAAPGRVAFKGRVVDAIGVPLPGAEVNLAFTGMFSGKVVASSITDATGRFELDGAACPVNYVVVVTSGTASRAAPDTRRPPLDLGDLQLVLPLALISTVGDGGDNHPLDVRRMQDRLQRLGRLTAPDVAAEVVDLAALPPVTPGPRLMAAMARHCVASLGRPLPVMCTGPANSLAAALATTPPFPLVASGLGTPVGSLPGADPPVAMNAPDSVDALQQRLNQLGLLTRADLTAEFTDVAVAGPVDMTVRPQTLAAIAGFDKGVCSGSLRAIVPGAFNDRVLGDPFAFAQPIRLSGSVGTGGDNKAVDVRLVQIALRNLDMIDDADYRAERVAAPAGADLAYVGDDTIPKTIFALQGLHTGLLGEPGPAVGILDPQDSSLARLNRPARLELTDTVGWGPALACANHPGDVRLLQDRLLLVGFLSAADYDAERADPHATDRIDQAAVAQTAQALALLSEQRGLFALTGSVGAGGRNNPAEVRTVQDRLYGLLFLAEADYQAEKVDPAAAAVNDAGLERTFAAIAALRQRLFELPAATGIEPWTAQPLVTPGDETHACLIDPLFFGRPPLVLTESVGRFGWNFPVDVRALQERLNAMRLLPDADFNAEAVDPMSVDRVQDARLLATRSAIRRLRKTMLGEPNPVPERVDPRSPALAALERRLGARTISIAGSVGDGGRNNTFDVLMVQRRLLELGFLGFADFETESLVQPALGGSAIADAQMPQTIAALRNWQAAMSGTAPAQTLVELSSEVLYALSVPVRPRQAQLRLTNSVGRLGHNTATDVRVVQDRLFELGTLSAIDYYTERIGAALAGPVAEAAIQKTIGAITLFQQTLAGLAWSVPDSQVSPGGRAQARLEDPACTTPTVPNPNCILAAAGPKIVFADADLMRTIGAIEAQEGGVSFGEIPAILRNASGTPTSWGKAQVIGGTAVGEIATNAALQGHYGLTASVMSLQALSAAVLKRFNAITAAVAAGTSEAALQAQFQAYTAANAVAVQAESGFTARDIENMFRAAQLLRQLIAAPAGTTAAALCDPITHPDSAANIARLKLALSDVDAYLSNLDNYGEHRQGFVTRSIFMSGDAQTMRNAMTDDSGHKLGRLTISDNWTTTAGLGLTMRQRAEVTAIMHNRGGIAANWAATLPAVEANAYVQSVMKHY